MIVTVASLKDARAVWGGAFRTCAVRAGGKAQCWMKGSRRMMALWPQKLASPFCQ